MPADAFVLDASITAAWLLPDESSEPADRLYARLRAGVVEAHAPELWLWECAGLLAQGVRHGRMGAEAALQLWGVLDAVRSRVELATLQPAQVRACLSLAVDLGLSLHQATYLWLARSLKLPLLTHDPRLAAAAARQAVAVLTVDEA